MTALPDPVDGSPGPDAALGEAEPVALELDCRGMKCPQPIIVLAERIGEVPVGELVELLADDPAAAPDVAAWCRMRGHELLATEPPKFRVRRLQ